MDRAALAAGAQRFALIEGREKGRQVAHDALQLHLDAVDDGAAVVAIPLKGVGHALGPLAFDHQADAALDRALGRMGHVGRQQENVALADSHVLRPAIGPQAQIHVAFQLIEELLQRIDVIVGALVRPADDGDDEVGILPDLGVANRRLQLLTMISDPMTEVEGRSMGQHGAVSGNHR